MTHPNLLAIEHDFSAPRGFVFTLWSNPALVSGWWGPEHHHLTTCEIDFRPGGNWRFNMERDGTPHWAHGTYHQILPDRQLVFSYRFPELAVQSIVSIHLAPMGTGTRMAFLQTGFPDAEQHAGHRGGWMSSFSILEDLLLKLHGIGSVYPALPQAKVSSVAQDLAEARRRHDAALTEGADR
jgi:uncharacterized protein YndB with AHSA1/START domain